MLLLWIFLSLAASFLLPATGEVVRNFKACKEFFLGGNPPDLKPMNAARICQSYKDKFRFATMYDKTRRIPLFSAYKYNAAHGERPEEWMIEPQLALPGDRLRKNMELVEDCGIRPNVLKESQAIEQDYEGYDRGHLAPDSHQPNQDSKAATYALTNIVPQFQRLNQGKWREYEENINVAGCRDTYIIVGAVPGNRYMNDRVNIPSHIWAAGCCVLKDGKRNWAVLAKNNKDIVERLNLGELQRQLAILYRKKKIDLFNGACRGIP
ncbi:Endonuclease domain-containing 1 protein, partial [Ophiophagus hannah]